MSARRYRPYPAYRDSGVEWLGEIPAGWEVMRLKRLVGFRGGGTPTRDNLEYWRGDIPWVSPKDMKVWLVDETEDKITPQAVRESATKPVPKGAVLIVVRSGILAHSIPVAIAGLEVTINQDLKALIPRGDLSSEFLAQFISGMQRELLVEWKKEGATVESLELKLVAETPMVLPPLSEQRAIAAFLDRETARIDALVAKKERLIGLLQEKRTALITRAVTRGLDPTVPMKDSGVEWLGEIPAGWEVKRLRFVTESNPLPSEVRGLPGETEVSFVPMEAVGEHGGLSLEVTKQLADVKAGYTYFRDGDVVIAKITPCFENGKGALAAGLTNGIAFGTTELHVLRATEGADRHFMFYVTLSDAFRRLGEADMYGAGGQKRVSESFVRNFSPAVPSLPEQRAIAAFLDRETERIDALVARVREAIERLKELRTALISAAVTGKIDVREEAA